MQQQNDWDARALVRACGVTQRTIYRDLTLLQGANNPSFFDEERRCYRIRPDFFIPATDFSLDEAMVLAIGEEIGKKEQIPFTLAAAPGRKICAQLSEKVRRGFTPKLLACAAGGSDSLEPAGAKNLGEILDWSTELLTIIQ